MHEQTAYKNKDMYFNVIEISLKIYKGEIVK